MINAEKAAEDLAFVRALIEDDGTDNRLMGVIYFAAGLLYGLQCTLNAVLLLTQTQVSSSVWIAIGVIPTVLFLLVLFYTINKNKSQSFGPGTAKRAMEAAFAGAGLANIILAVIFGFIAFQKKDWSIWFMFPIVVCALQGAIWCTVTIVRRRFWHGLTALAWFIAAAALGLVLNDTLLYLLALGITMIICMALPGLLMMRAPITKP